MLLDLVSRIPVVYGGEYVNMTMYQQKMISEGNPFMDYLLSIDPFLFSIAKIFFVYFGIAILYKYRYRISSLYSSALLVFIYLLIISKHLWIMIQFIF